MTNNMHAIKVTRSSPCYEKVKHTLKTAFPLKEQSPLWALRLFAKHKCVDFLSFYDANDNFLGVSYSIHQDGKLLILYLAIDDTLRGKGWGTNIIKYLQEKDNIKDTVLDIESPYEECTNKDERLRRLHFYERLGFFSSEKEIVEPSCRYLILGTKKDNEELLDSKKAVSTYNSLTDILTSGLCKLNIKDANKG